MVHGIKLRIYIKVINVFFSIINMHAVYFFSEEILLFIFVFFAVNYNNYNLLLIFVGDVSLSASAVMFLYVSKEIIK